MTTNDTTSVALITGASQGLGLALARALAGRGWRLIVDARDAERLHEAHPDTSTTVALSGDIADPVHRAALTAAVGRAGRLDLLVNNASTLGVSPLPALRDYPLDALRRVFEVDVVAPLALSQALLPALRASGGSLVNISSDAAVSAYAGWGGYGAAKAALDQLSRVMAEEEPDVRVYAVDPGDMRTAMHQRAFPGEDISDRPLPEAVVGHLLRLLDERPPSGRHVAADWVAVPA